MMRHSSLWYIMIFWISRRNHIFSAQVLEQELFFLEQDSQHPEIILPPPPLNNGTEYSWIWTSHDGRNRNSTIGTLQAYRGLFQWNYINSSYTVRNNLSLTMSNRFEYGGYYSFSQSKPSNILMAQYEVIIFRFAPFFWSPIPAGSDKSIRCEVSHLPTAATMQWQTEKGNDIFNTTLLYDETIYIVIHNVDQYSQGKYKCSVSRNGTEIFYVFNTLALSTATKNPPYTLYRESSNTNDPSLRYEMTLVCISENLNRTVWHWVPNIASQGTQSLSILNNSERFTYLDISGGFSLNISPVFFEDSGRYGCNVNDDNHDIVTLSTLRVHAEPDHQSQPVVLTCEVSEVTGVNVTLAWQRMEGNRGLLVKQEVLTESHPYRSLSLALSSLSSDQLRWQCVVFTEGLLRATASITLTMPEETSSLDASIGSLCVVALILLSALVFYYKRCRSGPECSTASPLTEGKDNPGRREGDKVIPANIYKNFTEPYPREVTIESNCYENFTKPHPREVTIGSNCYENFTKPQPREVTIGSNCVIYENMHREPNMKGLFPY